MAIAIGAASNARAWSDGRVTGTEAERAATTVRVLPLAVVDPITAALQSTAVRSLPTHPSASARMPRASSPVANDVWVPGRVTLSAAKAQPSPAARIAGH